ncbi:MAG TPA: D-alanyl-D-alanine carboxypeptidase/D-alanyl-D-alanine-endopeptidase, partial [Allocoleopsis sp.]
YTKIDTLTVDDSYYKGEQINPNWSWEDIFFYYGAPINSLILNENTAVLTISSQKVGEKLTIGLDDNAKGLQIKNESLTSEKDGLNNVDYKYDFGSPILTVRGQLPVNAKPVIQGIAIPDPVGNFMRQLKEILAKEGISVKEEIKASDNRPLENEKEIAFVESPPLAEMIATMNLYSNNVYAESFLRTLGVDRKQFKNTAESGLNEMKNTLKEIGVNPDNYQLDDGSGLSRLNLINVEAIMQTLKGISQTKGGEIYKKSLPVAGVSGTLKNRFKETKAQGIVYAKTGTLTGASALSGYIDVPGYQTIIFSIIVNQSDQPVPEIRKAIDEIVLLLVQLQKC